MSKMLNLDEYAAPKRTVTIKGKTHEVLEMTVGMFIDATKEAQKLDAEKGEVQIGDQMQMMTETVAKHIPSLSQEELKSLSIEQIVILAKFIRGDMDKKDEKPAAEDAEGEAKKA